MKRFIHGLIGLLVLLVLFPGLGAQKSVTLVSSKDNTIFSISQNNSNGNGNYLFAGRTKTIANRRALIYFDLKDTIPAALSTYPNPFIDEINIIYRIGKKEKVQLGVYNLLGQQIELVATGVQSPGRYHFTWDGTDRSGNSVSTGMYYVILGIGEDRQVMKIMKTR